MSHNLRFFKFCDNTQAHTPHMWGNGLVFFQCPGRVRPSVKQPKRRDNS